MGEGVSSRKVGLHVGKKVVGLHVGKKVGKFVVGEKLGEFAEGSLGGVTRGRLFLTLVFLFLGHSHSFLSYSKGVVCILEGPTT